MRMIPGKTKVKMQLFRGITIPDMLVAVVFLGLIVLVYTSNLRGAVYITLGLLAVAAILLARIDEDPNYVYLLHVVRHLVYKRHYAKAYSDEMIVASYDEEDFMKLAMENAFSEAFKQELNEYEASAKVFSGAAPTKQQKKSERKAYHRNQRKAFGYTTIIFLFPF